MQSLIAKGTSFLQYVFPRFYSLDSNLEAFLPFCYVVGFNLTLKDAQLGWQNARQFMTIASNMLEIQDKKNKKINFVD